MTKIKVLLVDDHEVFARSASQYLSKVPRLEVLPAAQSGVEALTRVAGERPDLVLMDIHMPSMSGLEATSRLKAQEAAPKVVAISLEHSSEMEREAREAGADGFISKVDIGRHLPALIERLFPEKNKS